MQSNSSSSDIAMAGHVIGGQQPVNHASIEFYGVSNSGYNTASTALTPVVMSNADGSFQLASPISCETGAGGDQLVYVVATGGNPGGFDETNGPVNNNALALMAALGRCDSLNSSTEIQLNELTTVAAVWALAPFMTSYEHVSTSAGNASGLINAFDMANVLADYSTGISPGLAPSGATVPYIEMNSMANVLASCVNLAGWTAGDLLACDRLFTLATPQNGTEPQNTISAALDIALNPGHNAADISILPTPQAPFQPGGYAANDWTMAVNFPVGTQFSTNGMAFDAKGNLWIVAVDGLYELSPTGTVLGSNNAMAGNSVAIDPSGNIWATTAPNTLSELLANSSTVATFSAPNGFSTTANGLAIDGSGNPWYTCDFCTALYKLNVSDSSVGTFATAGSVRQTNISIDGAGDVWVGNSEDAQMDVFDSTGTALPHSPFSCGFCGHPAYVANDHSGNAWVVGNDLTYVVPSTQSFTNFDTTAGGLFQPNAVAVDGAGNAWVANAVGVPSTPAAAQAGSISEFTSAGAVVSPATGYLSDTLLTPQSIAVDGSGSVWVRNTGSKTVTAFVGAGVPVVTPLALGVKNNSVGSQPE